MTKITKLVKAVGSKVSNNSKVQIPMNMSKPTEIKVMNGNGNDSFINIKIDAETIEVKYTDDWESKNGDDSAVEELSKFQSLTIKQAEKGKTQDNKN